MSALKEQIDELKGELNIYKASLGNEVLVAAPKPKVDVSKLKEFNETRFAKDMDNFLWGMEHYSRAKGIMHDATKVNFIAMYFTDATLLWWCCRSTDERRGGTVIGTWEFQSEFKG